MIGSCTVLVMGGPGAVHISAVTGGIAACGALLWPWKQAGLNLVGSSLEFSFLCTILWCCNTRH